MAARRGVTADQVAAAALAVLDEAGRVTDVRPAAVAKRLGIRSQSLYAHVDGAAGLRRLLALRSLDDLAEAVTTAAVGRSGRDATEAVVRAHLSFALVYPGRFSAAIHPPGRDSDLEAAVNRVGRPLQTVLQSLGLDDGPRVHWTRLQLAVTAGFASLVHGEQLTLAPGADDTVEHLVAMLLGHLDDMVGAGPLVTSGP